MNPGALDVSNQAVESSTPAVRQLDQNSNRGLDEDCKRENRAKLAGDMSVERIGTLVLRAQPDRLSPTGIEAGVARFEHCACASAPFCSKPEFKSMYGTSHPSTTVTTTLRLSLRVLTISNWECGTTRAPSPSRPRFFLAFASCHSANVPDHCFSGPSKSGRFHR